MEISSGFSSGHKNFYSLPKDNNAFPGSVYLVTLYFK